MEVGGELYVVELFITILNLCVLVHLTSHTRCIFLYIIFLLFCAATVLSHNIFHAN